MFYYVKQLKMDSIRHSSKGWRNRNIAFIPWCLVLCFPRKLVETVAHNILKTIQQNLKISANLHLYHSTVRKKEKTIFNLPELGEGLSSSLELALNSIPSQTPI